MITQAAPQPQPFRSFGPRTSMPSGPPNPMIPPPRLPPSNMFPPGFNQFKQVNIPPPNMLSQPSSIATDIAIQAPPQTAPPGVFPPNQQMMDYDAKRQQRRNLQRRTVDYNASIVQQIKNRVWRKTSTAVPFIQPDVLCYNDLASPQSFLDNPVNSVTTRFVRTATNKIRCPLFTLSWTPEGRRLITGASSGEFTLWGGLTFNFETVLQAHESAVRAMQWSHNDTWLISADHNGLVKYWQSNMNNVKTLQAHVEAVRGVCFSPTDNKFATGSDDGMVKIWDFYRCFEERILRGHGADVKCIDWHPSKGLLVSGSKDSQQPLKLWDPKSGSSLSTIHMHKSTVMDLQWNRNGNWLLTASRDHLIKVFDIRAMKEIQTFRGHKKEATAVDWHPVHESLFASGGSDGAIMFWNMGSMKEVGAMDHAHDAMIWSVKWHPLGHILASGSNDHTCKFWTRNRPGDKMKDKFNLNTNPLGDDDYEYDIPIPKPSSDLDSSTRSLSVSDGSLPGLSLASSLTPTVSSSSGIPGIDSDLSSDEKAKDSQSRYNRQQTYRSSAFKLPSLKSNESNKKNQSVSTFKIPNPDEVRQILGGSPSGNQASKMRHGRGLLPTPSKDVQLDVIPNVSANTFEVLPGMVIDAEEVWLDEKLILLDEERLEYENQSGKRVRRVSNSDRDRMRGEGMDRDVNTSRWGEPPEKKRLLQGQAMFYNRDSDAPIDADFRSPVEVNRNRSSNQNAPFENRSMRNEPNNSSYHHGDDLMDRPAQKPNRSPRDERRWNENDNYNHHNQSPRGRRRGGGAMNQSMQRNNPNKSPSSFRDQSGAASNNRSSAETPANLSWRERQQNESFEGNHEKNPPSSPLLPNDVEWDNDNYLPGQRRGPHPLLKRGRGAGVLGGRRPASFSSLSPTTTTSPSIDTNLSASSDRTVSSDGLSSPKDRTKLKGLMDDIEFSNNQLQHWQTDNTSKAT
eukprot:gene15183-16745_t